MRTIVITLMLVTSLAAVAQIAGAQSRSFPYDAIIAEDEVYARGGPDKRYYPTARLRKGDHVTVIRHDPGGWFMIEPPPGSFAWVREELIKHETDNRGVVASETQVIAWVGTSFGDDHYVEQRRLQPHEEVEILGEKMLRDERGDVKYLRIRSPKGHFRWIPGSKVVTSDKQLAAANARSRGTDPFAGDAKSEGAVRNPNASPVDMASLESPTNSGPIGGKSVPQPKDLTPRPAPTPKDIEDEPSKSRGEAKHSNGGLVSLQNELLNSGQNSFEQIDHELQEILKRDTRDWDFTAIEAKLRELQRHEATSNGAARRIASLGKYKQIKTDQEEFARIMAETNRRDAELAAAQGGRQPLSANNFAAAKPSNNARPVPLNGATSTNRAASPGRSPTPAIQSRPSPTTSGNRQPASSNSSTRSRFDGAGIIQRSGANQPGLPKYVLMHPNGQRLAYLEGDGVDLDKYLGESMGLEGERFFRPDLKSDFLRVKSLQPVKLKP